MLRPFDEHGGYDARASRIPSALRSFRKQQSTTLRTGDYRAEPSSASLTSVPPESFFSDRGVAAARSGRSSQIGAVGVISRGRAARWSRFLKSRLRSPLGVAAIGAALFMVLSSLLILSVAARVGHPPPDRLRFGAPPSTQTSGPADQISASADVVATLDGAWVPAGDGAGVIHAAALDTAPAQAFPADRAAASVGRPRSAGGPPGGRRGNPGAALAALALPLVGASLLVGVVLFLLMRRTGPIGQPEWSTADPSETTVAPVSLVRNAASAQVALMQAERRVQLAEQMRTRLLRHLSHELRTPLNAMMGFAQMLQSDGSTGNDAARRSDYADHLLASGEALLTTLDDLSLLELIESGGWVADRSRRCAGAMLRDSVVRLQPALARRHLTMEAKSSGLEQSAARVDWAALQSLTERLALLAMQEQQEGAQLSVRLDQVAGGDAIQLRLKAPDWASASVSLQRITGRDPWGNSNPALADAGGTATALICALLEVLRGRLTVEMAADGIHLVVRVPLDPDMPVNIDMPADTDMMHAGRARASA